MGVATYICRPRVRGFLALGAVFPLVLGYIGEVSGARWAPNLGV